MTNYEIVPDSCRICLKKQKKLRSIYAPLDEGDEPPNEMLKQISGSEFKSTEEPALPQHICKSCELSLNMAYQFREKVLETERILTNFLNERTTIKREDFSKRSDDDCQIIEEFSTDSTTNCQEGTQTNEECSESADEVSIKPCEEISSHDRGEVLVDIEYLDDTCDYFEGDENLETENEVEIISTENEAHTEIIKSEELRSPRILHKETVEDAEFINTVDEHLRPGTLQEAAPETLDIPSYNAELYGTEYHERRNANSHICDICGNLYEKRGRMMEHRRRHFKNLQYVCEICNKGFHTRETLRKHLFLHKGGKPFKCSYCSRTFFYESVRKAHEDIHKGLKPYICKQCNKAFAYPHALKKHLLIHEDIKLYHCDYCNKDFRLQHHMKQHVETKLHRNAVSKALEEEGMNVAYMEEERGALEILG